MGHTDNEKFNTWGLEATAILRCVKGQHIKANILVDSVLRLRAVGLYHDPDFKDHQQKFSAPFEPLPSVEPVTDILLEVNEILIAPNIEKPVQNYNTLHDLPTAQTDEAKLSLEMCIIHRHPTMRTI